MTITIAVVHTVTAYNCVGVGSRGWIGTHLHQCSCGWLSVEHNGRADDCESKPCPRRTAETTVAECNHAGHQDEVDMSDCEYGCKVMRCSGCGDTQVVHSRTYGCPQGA
jgi:hypothetical protein